MFKFSKTNDGKFEPVGRDKFEISHSNSLEDPDWDEFLLSTPLGEFQQTSMWACVKSLDGWKPLRIVINSDGEIKGGFQLLWRQTRLGRIAYVSRGPVFGKEDPSLIGLVIKLLKQTVKKNSIKALIVQAPAASLTITSYFKNNGFPPNYLVDLITATAVVDLSNGLEKLEGGLSSKTRNKIRQARRKGVTVREGKEGDIGTFFRLMAATCHRQGLKPNPSSERVLREVWTQFRPKKCCRLTVAEYQNTAVSAILCIPFRNNVNVWKIGSLTEYLSFHAIDLLYYDALCWAHSRGYKMCDFGSLDRNLAEIILSGQALPTNNISGRDIFHLRFGVKPMLLPEPFIYIENIFLRSIYRFLSGKIIRKYLPGKRMQ